MDRNDEISVLDAAVFLAENWLVLLLVPLAAALAAYLYAASAEPRYTATITSDLTAFVKANVGVSELDQMAAARATDGLPGLTASRRNNVTTVTATATSEQEAIRIARSGNAAMIAPLTSQIEAEIERLTAIESRFIPHIDDLRQAPSENAQALASLEIALADTQIKKARAEDALESAAAPPEVETDRTGRDPLVLAFTVFFFAAILTLGALLLRAAAGSITDEEDRRKIARIRRALLLRRRPSS